MNTTSPPAESRQRSISGRRRSHATPPQTAGLVAVTLVGGAAAILLSDSAPVGIDWVDALYQVSFVALTVIAGSRARRWNLLIAACLISVGSDGVMLLVAAASLVIGVFLAWRQSRNRIVGGTAGALIAVAALSLAWPASPQGATALLAACAVVPLWISGYRVARRPTRRAIRWVVAGLAVVVVLGFVAAAVFAITQSTELLAAADDTVEAAGSITSGDGSGATQEFEANADRFAGVASTARAPWMIPARLVPGVAQNVAAVTAAADAGADLNTAAAALAANVDYDALRLESGAIDVSRLETFRGPVELASTTIEQAGTELAAARSPWLLGPLSDELEGFTDELARAEEATSLGESAIRHLPGILGADGPRRYLLLLGNPAETRDIGGHLGNWAEIVADEGKLDVIRVGVPYELYRPGTEPRPVVPEDLAVPPSLLEMSPDLFPQNWGASPELATVSTLAGAMYPQAAGGAPIDGVIYADPIAFAALLELTGPVQAEGVELGPDNAVQYLTRDQFASADTEDEAPVSDLIEIALDRLTDSQLPSPARLAEVFSPTVDTGHLQFVTDIDTESDLLRQIGLEQPVEALPDADTVAVISRNANPSKIDSFLERTIDYDVAWDPANGSVRSRAVVTLHNTAPTSGLSDLILGSAQLQPAGTNRTQLSVLSPFDAVGALVDGEPAGLSSRADLGGLTRHSLIVQVPAGERVSVVIDLQGEVEVGPTYSLRWYAQPLLRPDDSRLILRPVGATFPGGTEEGVYELDDRRVQEVSVRVDQ